MNATDRNPSVITDRVLSEVLAERLRQDIRWGQQDHPMHDATDPDGVTLLGRSYAGLERACKDRFRDVPPSWAVILLEEVFEVMTARTFKDTRAELVQVAAVAVAAVESMDRNRVSLTKPIAWGVDLSALISDLPDASAFSADALARALNLPEGSVELRLDATPIPFLLPPDELTITVIKPVTAPCPGCGHAEHSGFCRELCMPAPGDVDECGCLAPGYCDRCGGTGVDPEDSSPDIVTPGEEQPGNLEPCRQCQLPALCDGCGHAKHAADQCRGHTFNERCECDEPLPPTPVLTMREAPVWVKGQCPYCTGSTNPDIRDHVCNVHPDLFAGWQDHLSTHPLPNDDPFHQPLDPEIRDRLFTGIMTTGIFDDADPVPPLRPVTDEQVREAECIINNPEATTTQVAEADAVLHRAEDCGEWVAYDPADDAPPSGGAGVPEYTDADRAAISECTHWKFPGAVCSHDTDPPSVTPEEIDANYAKDLVEDARPSTVHHHTFDRLHGFCRCGERPEE